ncbi:MAG: penicillin-binding protein 2 [Pseudomonadota bacterium]
MKLTHEYTADLDHRFKYLILAIIVFFVIVLVRLYYLQILKGDTYRFFSTENSIKETKIPAARGIIFDRKGKVLVENRPAYDIAIIPQYVLNPTKVLAAMSKYLDLPLAELQEKWAKRGNQPSYRPIILKEDVERDVVAKILARQGVWYDDATSIDDFRGVEVLVRYLRTYPNGSLATHILGYVREIDSDRLLEYEELYPNRYKMGDQIGITGIEEVWDMELRGQDGYEQHIVNAVGREVDFASIAEDLQQAAALAGNSLLLTIDKDVQEVAQEYFEPKLENDKSPRYPSTGKKGAAVMLNLKDGGILAMYSSPSYDLNVLASPEGQQYWNRIAADPKGYLINRAIQGAYPPASTYKVVTAIAALAEKLVKPEEKIGCRGALFFGGRPFRCWRKGGHGAIALKEAIAQSCDVYFYLMGLRLGVDAIAKYANFLGLGQKTGIALSNERSGLIPTSAWKKKRFGEPWQEGENLSIAVGQSYDLVTPLQNALVVAHIANDGQPLMPHLIGAMFDDSGKEIYQWRPSDEEMKEVPIPKDVLKKVREAMIDVVATPSGTAHHLSRRKISMGGKTGTAQVIALDSNVFCEGDRCKDHAWFIGFAPAENPQVAAAVIVENGGFGSTAAAPIVGAMFEKYFENQETGE